MGEKVTRRRRRRLLVPLLAVGVAAAWFVKRRLDDGQRLDEGWHELPPASWPVPTEPVRPAPAAQAAPEPVPAPPKPAAPKPAPPRPAPAAPSPAALATASVAATALTDAPFAGSVRAQADGTTPDPDFVVKAKTATKVFHAPGGAYYNRTRADVWFRTAADAQAAGFTERGPRRHR